MLTAQAITLMREKNILLRDFNVEFAAGEVWGILGNNGSGKTTLLHALAGLFPAKTGEIKIAEKNIANFSRHELAKQLGLLLQQQEYPFPSTVMEMVLAGRHPHISLFGIETKEDYLIATDALNAVDLQGFQDRNILSLSGGERRRVALAMLLAQDPSIYLLDEPTNHLDPKHQRQILQHVLSLAKNKNKLIVMSLHDLNHAALFFNKILLLTGQGDYHAGHTCDLLQADVLTRLYQQTVVEVKNKHYSVWSFV